MHWVLKNYKQLTVEEFHDILQLRINVFVVEQNCPYPELDGKDKIAYHYYAIADENSSQVLAYTRLFKPGDYYQQAAIGRVVVNPKNRNTGLGHELIKRSIYQIENIFHTSEIKIGAQTYLEKFYISHGFSKVGEEYLEDGIPHIYMIKE